MLALAALATASLVRSAAALPPTAAAADPCVKIAGSAFVSPADALACVRSFPFNETIRQNVMAVSEGVIDFYNFEFYYLNSPPPFQESTVNIRAEFQRLKTQHYTTDYDFSVDLYNVTTRMNDGHTRWFPSCYQTFQNLLPAPVVSLEVNGVQNVYVVPDLVELISLLPSEFTDFLANLNFNWQQLAGAKVLEIEGIDAYAYVDEVAREISGNFLDHGIRVNSAFSSYRIVSDAFSQRFGDLAGPPLPTLTGLTMTVVLANTTRPQTIRVPYVASFLGNSFTDGASFFANNCAETPTTNGQNLLQGNARGIAQIRKQPIANIIDLSTIKSVALPSPFVPTAPSPVSGNSLKFFTLPAPHQKTGVVFVGDFEPADFFGFQTTVAQGVAAWQAAGVENVIIDLTDNGGGFVCLGLFLHQFFAGTKFGYAGFASTMRANPLAQKIVKNIIAQDIEVLNYTPDNWAFLNDTELPNTFDFISPPQGIVVNGVLDENSQRIHDTCAEFAFSPNVTIPEEPPFDLSKVVITGNAWCASTCALFSTAMVERHPQIRTVIFGGKPGEAMQYKGMAGNQVLEWADLDTEIKTSGLANDPLAPPDLLVNANFRTNWRAAWSFRNTQTPIAYESELATIRIPYTAQTYNNPQALWTLVAETVLHS